MTDAGGFDEGQREKNSCALPGYHGPRSGALAGSIYMGADRLYKLRATRADWEHPPEPAAEGCPGAWYRSPFFLSFARYMRRDVSGPNGIHFIDNPTLATAPEFIQRIVLGYYEPQRIAALNFLQQAQSEAR